MEVTNLGPVGAQIDGMDLKSVLDDQEIISEIRKAFVDNSVLVFKNQNLNPSHLLSVAEIIGCP